MRDRFVGDVGDFGKYGLLRALCGSDLRLGVLWYFVRDRMTAYLEQPRRFKECDATLFEALRELVGNCQRSLATVEAGEILPQGTVYNRKPVPTRIEMRRAWANHASEEMQHCDLVFLDPDNGIKGPSPRSGTVSAEHVYYDDLKPFFFKKRAIVIYHHFGHVSHVEQDEELKARASEMRDSLGAALQVWALVWRPFAPRAYFIIPNGRQGDLAPKMKAFLSGPWGQHFEQRPVLE